MTQNTEAGEAKREMPKQGRNVTTHKGEEGSASADGMTEGAIMKPARRESEGSVVPGSVDR